MRAYIHHLINNNIDEIVEKSFLNCHVLGVHSIMLIDKPEQRLRMFITDESHELWRNSPVTFNKYGLSTAFHSHHCNVTLIPIFGAVYNWKTCEVAEESVNTYKFDKFEYTSGITGTGTGFNIVERDCNLLSLGVELIQDGVHLPASVNHTIFVGKGQRVAWLVAEGKEDPDYKAISYSNVDLENESFSNLYIRPNEAQIYDLLKSVHIL